MLGRRFQRNCESAICSPNDSGVGALQANSSVGWAHAVAFSSMVAGVAATNLASARVLKKCGLVQVDGESCESHGVVLRHQPVSALRGYVMLDASPRVMSDAEAAKWFCFIMKKMTPAQIAEALYGQPRQHCGTLVPYIASQCRGLARWFNVISSRAWTDDNVRVRCARCVALAVMF